MIEVTNVSRHFGDLVAVDKVSLTAASGEVIGLLGHNGAGKTTILRLISGLLRPTAGRISVDGMDPVTDGEEVRSLLGVLPSTPQVDGRLTATENLLFVADTFDLDTRDAVRRAYSLLEQFGLSDRRDDLVSDFSSGMMQRLALARILLSQPKILLLDEPTSAMDPLGTRQLIEALKHQTQREGRVVLIATHHLAEAAELCDEVLILYEGAVIRQGTPNELVERLGTTTTIRVGEAVGGAPTAARLLVDIDPSARFVEHDTVAISRVSSHNIAEIVRLLVHAGLDIYEIVERRATLEDLYLHIHGNARTVWKGPAA